MQGTNPHLVKAYVLDNQTLVMSFPRHAGKEHELPKHVSHLRIGNPTG